MRLCGVAWRGVYVAPHRERAYNELAMLAFERRWVREILGSFAPVGSAALSPREGDVDYLRAFYDLREQARPIARLGVRLALWLVALAPVWLLGRARTLPRLSLADRQALLARLLEHRVYFVREAAFLLKLTACVALFASEALRAQSGYDRAPRELILLERRPR